MADAGDRVVAARPATGRNEAETYVHCIPLMILCFRLTVYSRLVRFLRLREEAGNALVHFLILLAHPTHKTFQGLQHMWEASACSSMTETRPAGHGRHEGLGEYQGMVKWTKVRIESNDGHSHAKLGCFERGYLRG